MKGFVWTMTHDVDYLVLGSGVAGLTYALNVAPHGPTLILTKKSRAESNTNYAQGGIAGALGEDDDVRLHAEDTLLAGAGLCHLDAVEVLVTEGPERIRDLIRLGAQFDMVTDAEGHRVLSLGREGGHSRNRIVHALDHTGWECERALLAAVKDAPNLEVLEHYFVADLLTAETDDGRRCVGAVALDTATGELHRFRAKAVLLATGGCGRVYKHTTNPAIATGDGVAMAWRAGASVANMEFIQFHPTALYHPRGESFLISEAVRGEGGILRTADGATFMERYDPRRELAPRDIVARAIHAERLKRGEPCVYLDVTHLDADFLRRRFPTIYERCKALGIDITREPIPVVPAAHYMCGGVQTDLHGQTILPGLYAAGEVACTGVHGANRLASNSLLEAMVFGYRAAQHVVHENHTFMARAQPALRITFMAQAQPEILRDTETQRKTQEENPVPERLNTRTPEHPNPVEVLAVRERLQSVMNDYVGIVRNSRGLGTAERQVAEIKQQAEAMVRRSRPDPDLYELWNMATVAHLIIRSALLRRESRGLHYTTDYPETDDATGKRDTVLGPESGP